MLSSIYYLALVWAASATADQVVDRLSFGHKGRLAPNGASIPGWTLLGKDYQPELYSDKVILTPPYGGNKRGALWTEDNSGGIDWTANIEFRASGDSNGKGNMNIWYVKDGAKKVGTSSIYTVGKFEGLGLVIDSYHGTAKIRGFLNDGTVDYASNPHIDGLPFGHCDYNYRNLGRPSKVQIRARSHEGLEVLIDGKKCFGTSKIVMPFDYGFGITAASADPPDSFEVFKFELSVPHLDHGAGHDTLLQQNAAAGASKQQPIGGNSGSSSSSPAGGSEQRLNIIDEHVQEISSAIKALAQAQEARYKELLDLIKSGGHATGTGSGLESRLSNLDRAITGLTNDLKSTLNHDEKFAKISKQLADTHEGLSHHLSGKLKDYVQHHTPRIGFILFCFMIFQSCCLALLLWQKYRKGTMPKKFL